MINIVKVNDSKGGMKDFINLQYDLYRDDEHFVPPLRFERKEFFSKKNPYFDRHEFWTKDHWDETFEKEFPPFSRGFIGAVED